MRLSATSRAGFTLIELLTVMAIVAILLIAALPAIKSIQSSALQVGVRQISNGLQLARQYAVTHRTNVRLVLAVDTSSGNISPDLVCRAYAIYEAVKDANGTVVCWTPLEDWRLLPQGIVITDLNNNSFNPLIADPLPPIGPTNRLLGSAATIATAWQYLDSNDPAMWVTNVSSSGTLQWNVSAVEFKPTGLVANVSNISGAGIRVITGSVIDPTTRNILVADTNNYAYIEYDQYSGRVRAHFRESFK